MDLSNHELFDGTCRCCLDKGTFDKKYNMLNCLAVDLGSVSYTNMFSSCFSIDIICTGLKTDECYICDLCIIRLKDAFAFKLQVEKTQKSFHMGSVCKIEDIKVENNNFDEDWKCGDPSKSCHFKSNESEKTATAVVRRRGPSRKDPAKPAKRKERRELKYKTDWSIIARENGSRRVTQKKWNKILNSKMCLKERRCLVCDDRFVGVVALRRHLNEHYPVYSCLDCDKSFASKDRVWRHNMTHEEGTFPCTKCKEVFSNKSKWRLHSHKHYSSLRNPCHLCPERFNDYGKLLRHMVAAHGAPKNRHKCGECDASFIRNVDLSVHVRRKHMKERNQICSACGLGFFSTDELKNHMVTHFGERTFECSFCAKSYARRKTLQEHLKIHTNDKRFMCCLCDRTFTQKCTLKGHMKTHSKNCSGFKEIRRTMPSGLVLTYMVTKDQLPTA